MFCFCGADPNVTIQLSYAKTPLLGRLTTAMKYNSCFPNASLEPEWDIVSSIITTLQPLLCVILFPHVLGHQDDKIPYDSLPLESQLNCDADSKADYYQSLFESYRPTVP
jgi:hypothetical protein